MSEPSSVERWRAEAARAAAAYADAWNAQAAAASDPRLDGLDRAVLTARCELARAEKERAEARLVALGGPPHSPSRRRTSG